MGRVALTIKGVIASSAPNSIVVVSSNGHVEITTNKRRQTGERCKAEMHRYPHTGRRRRIFCGGARVAWMLRPERYQERSDKYGQISNRAILRVVQGPQ